MRRKPEIDHQGKVVRCQACQLGVNDPGVLNLDASTREGLVERDDRKVSGEGPELVVRHRNLFESVSRERTACQSISPVVEITDDQGRPIGQAEVALLAEQMVDLPVPLPLREP